MTDNSEISVASEDLMITYSNQNLQLKSKTVDQQIPINTIKSMQFKLTSVGLDALLDNNTSEKIEFYSLSGTKVGIYNSIEETREKIPAGIYVVKCNNKSFKVIF